MFAQVIVDVAHSNVDKIFEYSCPENLSAGTRVKVPFGGRVIDGFVIGVSRTSVYPAEKLKPVFSVFDEDTALVPECLTLMHEISSRYRVPKAAALRLFLPSEMRLGKVREAYKNFAVFKTADVKLSASAKKQAQALEYIAAEKEKELPVLCDMFGRGAINALVEKGAIELDKRKISRSPFEGLQTKTEQRTLTPAQRAALDNIENSDKRVHLIHGVTGSGKTEIYLNVIDREIKRGRTAIFLVPEISLTPQMLTAPFALRRSGGNSSQRTVRGRKIRRVVAAAFGRGENSNRREKRGVRPA